MTTTRTTSPAHSAKKQRKPSKPSPAARTPDPQQIVSGAGHPLDLGVRRALEERLGHDFGRVRLHTDRDAAALTDLLGADAVTVGEHIFFAEAAYRPETDEGRHLLAHELLHTVQSPHPLAALRLGRGLGAVSLPHQPAEKEAEQSADADAPAVTRHPTTPGWLRYARNDADRHRTERLDPATLVDRLSAGILRSLRGDPSDASGRVRQQLTRFGPELRTSVLDHLEQRLPSTDTDRLHEMVAEAEGTGPTGQGAARAPEPVTGTTERLEQEREREQDHEDADRAREEVTEENEKRRDEQQKEQGRKKQNERTGNEQDEAPQQRQRQNTPAAPRNSSAARSPRGPAAGAGAAAPQRAGTGPAGPALQEPESARALSEDTPQARAGKEKKEERDRTEERDKGTAERPRESREERRPAPAPAVKPPAQDTSTTPSDDLLPTDGDDRGDDQGAEDRRPPPDPAMAEAVARLEAAEKAERDRAAEPSAWDVELSPDDFLPPGDPDVSAVPTADRSTPGETAPQTVPAFPPPPPTKAERIQEQRETEDAEAPEEEPAAQDPGEAPQLPAAAEPDAAHPPEPPPAARRPAEPARPEPPAPAPAPAPAAREQEQPPAPDARRAEPEPITPQDQPPTARATAPAPTPPPEPEAEEAPEPPAPAPAAPGTPTAARDEPAASASPDAAPEPRSADPAPERATGAGAAAGTAPTAAPSPRGGGGGGAPAAARAEKQEPPAPDVSGAAPEAGLGTAAGLKPHKALETLKGVGTSVGRTVSDERAAVQDAPPSMQRPAGSLQTLHGAPAVSAPGEYPGGKVERTDAPAGETPEVEGDQKPTGEVPGKNMEPPGFFDTAGAVIGAVVGMVADAIGLGDLTDALDGLPTRDEGLEGATVGTGPPVPLEKDTDPHRTDEQRTELTGKSDALLTAGRDDAARPMGEDQIYPDVPGETLTGRVPGGKGGPGPGAGAAPPGGAIPVEAASEVAAHDHGPRLQAAFARGGQDMAEERTTKDRGFQDSRERSNQRIQSEISAGTAAQTGVRDGAATEIADARGQWRKEQDDKLAEIDGKTGEKYQQARDDIEKHKTETDEDVQEKTEQGDRDIDKERTDAQTDAERERDNGKQDAGNWLSRAIDWIKEQFTRLKDAIVGFFEAARNAVVTIINEVKQQVFDLIDAARDLIIGAINVFADALILFGDVLLAAFPEIRDKWRNAVNGARDAAIDKVNEYADKLKDKVGALLDALCDTLIGLLDVFEKGLLAAVDYVEGQVVGALELGAALLQGLGEFAAIAVDILADPGGWLGKAKSSAEDGAKNHLFRETESAVREWINQKIQEILGIDKETFDTLISGGMTLDEMVSMAWEAAKPQLPLIIGELVMTKIVAKLIPGAGWVMAIIDAIQTAIGALGAILRAMGLVIAYLKAVAGGSAGVHFAKAVAAGVVALLELIYQALVSGIAKYVRKVSSKLKTLASTLRKRTPTTRPKPSPGRPASPTPPRSAEGRRPAEREPRADRPGRPGPRPATPGGPPRRPRGTHRAGGAPAGRPAPTRTRPTRRGPARDTLGSGNADRPDRRRPRDVRGDDRPGSRRDDTGTAPRAAAPERSGRRRESDRPEPARRRPGTSGDGRARRGGRAASDRDRPTRRRDTSNRTRRPQDDGARRSRDAYRDRRDRLREQRRRLKEQHRRRRDERRSKEDSSGAKEDRLARIVARIRPKVHRMLGFGVRDFVLRAALRAMRSWYRLTDLSLSGSPKFDITAFLNPRRSAGAGEADRRKDLLHPSVRERAEKHLDPTFLNEWILHRADLDRDKLNRDLTELIDRELAARERVENKERRARARRKGDATGVPFGGRNVRGFRKPGELAERLGNLRNTLIEAGYDDAVVGIRGSSVKGYSSRKGTAFRWNTEHPKLPKEKRTEPESDLQREPSDVDFLVVSDKLEQQLRKMHTVFTRDEKAPAHHERVEPEELARQIPELAAVFDRFARENKQQLGRKGEAMVMARRFLEDLKRLEADELLVYEPGRRG